MGTRRAIVVSLAIFALLPGCKSLDYDSIGKAQISGTLEVRWIKPDRFVYVPLPDDPLTIVTSDKRTIKPGRMYTDGGSIPRMLWGVPGFSPWGYAPAYVMHDWVFEAHHCQYDEYKTVTFDDSSRYLAEAVKALMETGIAAKDEATAMLIYEGVRTPLAKSIWDRANACSPVESLESGRAEEGVLLHTIKIPKRT